jgi:hypothetical protein
MQKGYVTRCVEALITEHDRVPVWSFHVPHIHKVEESQFGAWKVARC